MFLSACQLQISEPITTAASHQGSVGDGPIIQADIQVKDANGLIVSSTTSNVSASYNVDIPVGSAYPVVITADGGYDIVSDMKPDFQLVSVATDPAINTVNINPFSTLITKIAQALPGGITDQNISTAKQYVLAQFGFGLDARLVADPITTPINEANVAAIIKATEALGETLRRSRDALQVSDSNITADQVLDYIASDMTDGLLDGRGQGASSLVAATTNIASAQVLVEILVNRLNVGGTDSTSRMDSAIKVSVANATMTTADVVITNNLLTQARKAVSAAQVRSPSASLTALAVALSGLSGNVQAADIEAALPANPSSILDSAVAVIASSTVTQQEQVNSVFRTSSFEIADSSYSVDENAGMVSITINRTGSSAASASVEWRTLTFNGYGTADWSNDYTSVNWTTLAFADGETSKTVNVTILPDSSVEGDETFTVMLQNPSNGISLGSPSEALVTIIDNAAASNTLTQPTAPAPTEPAPTEPAPTAPAPSTVKVADYYVARTGSDANPGTISSPFATVAKAIRSAQPGDLIYIRGGVYPITTIFNKSGTQANPITYEGYPGEKVIFDGSNLTPGASKDRIEVNNASWNIIRNIEVRNSPDRGIWIVNAHDNVFENIVTHDNYMAGLQIYGGNRNLILNVTSHSNYDPGNGGQNGDGMSVSNGSDNVFRNCHVYNNSDDGLDFWRSKNSTAEGCVSHDNGYGTAGNGNGFKIGGNINDMTIGGHTVTNSIAYNNKKQGFTWNGGYTPNHIYNNTAWNNGSYNFNFGGGAHVLRNNISYSGTVNMGSSDHKSNSWNLNITEPQFMSLDPTSANFLKPADSSLVIDKGAFVGLGYKGSAPDLGAIEVR